MGYLLIYEPFFQVVLFTFYIFKTEENLTMKITIKEDILANISRSKAYTEIGNTSSHYS